MPLRSGFPGERISVLPRPRVEEASSHPVTARILVTDSGYFPHAADHFRSRPSGCAQTILIVCVDGFGWCELPPGRHAVRPGQVLVLPAGTPHAYGAADDAPWTVWWLHVVGADIPGLIRALGSTVDSPVLSVPDVTRAVALIDEVILVMERDDSQPTLQEAAGAAWHLLALLSTARPEAGAGRADPVRVALAHLQRRYADKVSVAELAELVGLSPSHFSALFRKANGCGPREYQTRLRMMKCRQLLDTTDLPISSIARRVGYDDPFYFSRQFRAVHGVTASEHRARAKG
jgi:AraC family transcriptional regulator of arabinose operon